MRVPGTWHYGNGFWGKLMTPAEFPVYPCEFMVSRMGGFGGISVVMMPNGTVFYVWSDNDEFGWYSAVAESHKLIPQCAQCGGSPVSNETEESHDRVRHRRMSGDLGPGDNLDAMGREIALTKLRFPGSTWWCSGSW